MHIPSSNIPLILLCWGERDIKHKYIHTAMPPYELYPGRMTKVEIWLTEPLCPTWNVGAPPVRQDTVRAYPSHLPISSHYCCCTGFPDNSHKRPLY